MRNLVSVPSIPHIYHPQNRSVHKYHKGLSAKIWTPGPREAVLPWKHAAVTLLREIVVKSKLSCQYLWRITAHMYPDAGNIYTDLLCELWHPFWFSALRGCTYISQLVVLLPFCTASGIVCLCKFGFWDWGSLNAANLGYVRDQSPGYICIHVTQCARDLILSIFTCLHIFWASLHIYKWSELTAWEWNCVRLSHAGTRHIKALSIWRQLRLFMKTHVVYLQWLKFMH